MNDLVLILVLVILSPEYVSYGGAHPGDSDDSSDTADTAKHADTPNSADPANPAVPANPTDPANPPDPGEPCINLWKKIDGYTFLENICSMWTLRSAVVNKKVVLTTQRYAHKIKNSWTISEEDVYVFYMKCPHKPELHQKVIYLKKTMIIEFEEHENNGEYTVKNIHCDDHEKTKGFPYSRLLIPLSLIFMVYAICFGRM